MTTTDEPSLEELEEVHAVDLSWQSTDRALSVIAEAIDRAGDLRSRRVLLASIEALETLKRRPVLPEERALLHYFEGNAWSNLRAIREYGAAPEAWRWTCEERENEIRSLRQSLSTEGFEELARQRGAQILTNLGSAMSNVGRVIEAIEYWQRAASHFPPLGMSLLSMSEGLLFATRYLYDEGHRWEFAWHAYWLCCDAGEKALEGNAAERAKQLGASLDSWLPASLRNKRPTYKPFSLGRTERERVYRRWCLACGLFLNPMNMLSDESVAARDVMSLPPIVETWSNLGRGRGLVGFFNAMKQEYVAARILLHEGLTSKNTTYGDRDVFLQDPVDTRCYGVALEKIKAAFRLAYSVLDKVAVFLCAYLQIPIERHKIHFRTFWYAKPNASDRALRGEFVDRKNWPMRGLFWLSMDLDSRNRPAVHAALEPDARGISSMRNELEHGYVRVLPDIYGETWEPDHGAEDLFAHTTTDVALENRCLRILKKARAALMYLSMAIHEEERQRRETTEVGLAMPIGGMDVRHVGRDIFDSNQFGRNVRGRR